jgi:hypothetical protein
MFTFYLRDKYVRLMNRKQYLYTFQDIYKTDYHGSSIYLILFGVWNDWDDLTDIMFWKSQQTLLYCDNLIGSLR